MSRSTLCPLLLTANSLNSVQQIDRDMLEVAANHIDTAKNYGLKLEMSQQLLDDLLSRFPWTM